MIINYDHNNYYIKFYQKLLFIIMKKFDKLVKSIRKGEIDKAS